MNNSESQFNKGFFATVDGQKSEHSLITFSKPIELVCLRFYPENASIRLANTVMQSETNLSNVSQGAVKVYIQEERLWKFVEEVSVSMINNRATVALKVPTLVSKIMIKVPRVSISILMCYREVPSCDGVDLNLLTDDALLSEIKNKILNKKFSILDSISEPPSFSVAQPPQTSTDKHTWGNLLRADKLKEKIDKLEQRKLKKGINRKAGKLVKWLDEQAWKILRELVTTSDAHVPSDSSEKSKKEFKEVLLPFIEKVASQSPLFQEALIVLNSLKLLLLITDEFEPLNNVN